MTGLIGAGGALGGFALPFLLGLVRDATGSYGSGFLLFALTALACAALLTAVQQTWRERWADAGRQPAISTQVLVQD